MPPDIEVNVLTAAEVEELNTAFTPRPLRAGLPTPAIGLAVAQEDLYQPPSALHPAMLRAEEERLREEGKLAPRPTKKDSPQSVTGTAVFWQELVDEHETPTTLERVLEETRERMMEAAREAQEVERERAEQTVLQRVQEQRREAARQVERLRGMFPPRRRG